jgi:TetR/AcrR family transcriptional regulator
MLTYEMSMPPTKRLPAEERRQSILNAALSVLAEGGYAGMTTARLARKAGVTEPILYRHFPSKRVMLRALLDEVTGRMMTAFRQLTEGETDPVAGLRRICLAYPELARSYQREFRIINQALLESNDARTRELLAAHYDAYRRFLQDLIEQGQRAGSLRRDIPAAAGAWHMIHSALGFLMTQEIRGKGSASMHVEAFAHATLGGLLKIP